MEDLNTCDKCGIECGSQDLIWIDTEDYYPPEDEILKPSAYKKYSALCGDQHKDLPPSGCYYTELTAKSKKLVAKRKRH